MSSELVVTLVILVVEIALLVYCFMQSRRPPDPGRIRVFPYNLALIVLTLAILLTLAHVVSLITGVQLQPKRPKGMR